MRNKLYKIAIFLTVISFIPFLIFLSKRESPPEKVNIPRHKTQTIENFILKSEGENRWQLKAPQAFFLNENEIKLITPVLTVFTKNKIVIEAKEALYNKSRGIVYLKGITLKGKDFVLTSPEGKYNLKLQKFVTDAGCKAVYNDVNTLQGENCVVNLRSKTTIISNHVKTVIREVLK